MLVMTSRPEVIYHRVNINYLPYVTRLIAICHLDSYRVTTTSALSRAGRHLAHGCHTAIQDVENNQ